jgi:hypothetical protein
MTVYIHDDDEPDDICVDTDADGRIKIERGGFTMWFERGVARQMAMVIVGMTQMDRE